MAPLRRRDAERGRFGDGLAQQLDERVADAWVCNTPEVSSNFIVPLCNDLERAKWLLE